MSREVDKNIEYIRSCMEKEYLIDYHSIRVVMQGYERLREALKDIARNSSSAYAYQEVVKALAD